MWQVIYIAPNRQKAEELKEALAREGMLVNLRETSLSTHSGNVGVELLVPRTEAREAHELLNDILGRKQHRK